MKQIKKEYREAILIFIAALIIFLVIFNFMEIIGFFYKSFGFMDSPEGAMEIAKLSK